MNKIKRLLKQQGILLFLTVGLLSCTGPEGPQGPPGKDGVDGVDGVDGKDGNANVKIISLMKEDITWTAGSYLGRTANTFTWNTTEVSQEIVDKGTVLGYMRLSGKWYPLPFTWLSNNGSQLQHIVFVYSLSKIDLYAYQTSGVLTPTLVSEYRFMLITDSSVVSKSGKKKGNSDSSILTKLREAGVDTENYYEVCKYFGIDPE